MHETETCTAPAGRSAARWADTGERCASKGARIVRRGADGKGPGDRHLAGGLPNQKCRGLSSRICRGTAAKGVFLRRLYRRLWAGQVEAAVTWLEGYRPQSRNPAVLAELIGYLQARTAWLPNYRQRRREQQYIGSGHVEKANDLIVARRQKHKGMGWSLATSAELATLRTLLLNGGWDRYWVTREVLPLVEATAA